MFVVPRLLLTQNSWEAVGRVDSFWITVVIAENGEDGATRNVVLEHVIDGEFGVRRVIPAQLILTVVGDKVAGVD